uniref:Uncharacterized protein n=1 Tax=Nelumbo nucifera TaxID=4432 RepID=A0A822YZK6_NELNU|nr:TPA_asm: hypothetical protein HUJ06_008591 [Nelumbo nucifera]
MRVGRGLRSCLWNLGHCWVLFCVKDFIPSLRWVDYLSGLDARVEKNFKELDCFLDQVINYNNLFLP